MMEYKKGSAILNPQLNIETLNETGFSANELDILQKT